MSFKLYHSISTKSVFENKCLYDLLTQKCLYMSHLIRIKLQNKLKTQIFTKSKKPTYENKVCFTLQNDQRDSPPTPPIRTTSISPSRPAPPIPPKQRVYTPEAFDDDDFDDLDDFIQNDDGEDEKDDLLLENSPIEEKPQER